MFPTFVSLVIQTSRHSHSDLALCRQHLAWLKLVAVGSRGGGGGGNSDRPTAMT